MISNRYYYLLSLIFVFIIPTIVAGVFIRSQILIPNLVTFILVVLTLGSIWDIWATKHGKRDRVWLWCFNLKDTLGYTFLGLPIEEYLFYVFASTYSIFLWEVIGYSFSTGNYLTFLLGVLMGIWSLLFIGIPYAMRSKGDRLQ